MDSAKCESPGQGGRQKMMVGPPAAPQAPPRSTTPNSQRLSESPVPACGKAKLLPRQDASSTPTRNKGETTAEQLHQDQLLSIAREGFAGGTEALDTDGVPAQPITIFALPKQVDSAEEAFLLITPVTIRFKDITLIVTTKKPGGVDHLLSLCKNRKFASMKKKMILNLDGIEESFGPGDCVALMGSSGAGKSTMLNVLSCRVTSNVGGSIHLNEYKATPFACKQLGCFVQQLDLFYVHLTVSEHLAYQARLRLSPKTTAAERRETYEALIRKMGLWKVKDALIGDASTHGAISGGEQKRLSVATELLNQPSVIFADEPTSGLDSFMAKAVCDQLAQLAAANRTVVCTIHQPSSPCFALFNKVCLLAEGRVMFCGPRLAAVHWFEQRYKKCPPFTNPAEYLIECVSVGNLEEGQKKAVQGRILCWAEEWKRDGKQFVKDWEAGESHVASYTTMGTLNKMASVVLSSVGSMNDDSISQNTKADQIKSSGYGIKSKGSFDPRTAEKTALKAGCEADHDIDCQPGPAQEFEVDAFKRFDIHNPMKIHYNHHNFFGPGAEYHLLTEPKLNILQEFWVLVCRAEKLALRNKNMTWFRLIVTLITALIPSFMYFQLGWSMSDAWNRVAASFQVLLTQAIASMFVVVFSLPMDHPVAMRESESGVIHMWLYFLARVQTDSIVWIVFPAIYHLICFWIMRLGVTASKYFVTLCISWLVVQCLLSYGYLVAAIVPEANAGLAIVQVLQIILMLFSGLMVNLDEVGNFWVWVQAISPFYYGLRSFSCELFRGESIEVEGGDPVDGLVFLDRTFGMKDQLWLDVGILLVLLFGDIGGSILHGEEE